MTVASAPELFADLEAVTARAVELRHALHRQPELAYEEKLTGAAVCRELDQLGIPYQKGLAGGTGVVGLIDRGGDKCVALRADMDALPIVEETGLPYASERPGVMHACGHDGHMAILLAAAAILQKADFVGKVKLVFQPAEEGGCGAQKMVEDGVLEKPQVGAIFGLHGWPGLKVGTVATKPGALLASVDGFTIRVTGRGGHAAAPHDSIDPIVCASAMVQGLQSVVSREGDPTDACVVTVSQIHAGTAFNVIPDAVVMQGTLRALTRKRREAALASIKRISKGIAAAHRCEVELELFGMTPRDDQYAGTGGPRAGDGPTGAGIAGVHRDSQGDDVGRGFRVLCGSGVVGWERSWGAGVLLLPWRATAGAGNASDAAPAKVRLCGRGGAGGDSDDGGVGGGVAGGTELSRLIGLSKLIEGDGVQCRCCWKGYDSTKVLPLWIVWVHFGSRMAWFGSH